MDRETRERLKKGNVGKPPGTPNGGGDQVIRHTCGHSLSVAEYARVKCPKCQARMRKQFWDKLKEKRRLRDGHMAHARLPDKSEYTFTYHVIDGLNGRWTGTLTVYAADGTVDYTDTRSVKSLLNLAPLLDQKYRRWLHEKDNPPQPPTEVEKE